MTTANRGGKIECPSCDSGEGCELCGGAAEVEVIQVIDLGRTSYMVIRGTTDETPYFLVGKRGAFYGLMRNVPNPEALFMVNARGFTRGTPDLWFTDASGELEVVR